MLDHSIAKRPQYTRLPGGQHGLAPELVSADQRARLHAAMVQVVAESGYVVATVQDVLARAGVSRRTFYDHFHSKQDCFLATVDAIFADWMREARLAYHELACAEIAAMEDKAGEQLRVGALALFGRVLDDPLGARVSLIEILHCGSVGLQRLEQTLDEVERLIQQVFASTEEARQIPPAMATVIAGGVLEIVTARLRHDTTHELPSLAEPLAHWMLSYRAPTEANATPLTTSRPSDSVLRPAAARADSAPPRLDVAAERGGPPLWRDESARPIALPDARARILKAATEIVGARGYSALSVNEIVRSARVSHRTFRKHFATKDDAFVAAYRDSAKDTFEYALKAFAAETNWKMAVRAGLTAELRFLAMHPEVARLGFIEVYGVGAKALELRESELQLWKAALEPGYQESRAGPLPHKIVSEAVAGGIHQLMREGTLYQPEQLLDLVPDVTYAALAPFIGADAATLAADREA